MSNAAAQTIDADRLATIDYLLARQDISDCLARVGRGMDRFDRELFLSAFHDDAVVDAGALVGGPELIYQQGAALHEHGQSSTLHNLLNHSCELDGEIAHAETYFLYSGRNRNDGNWLAGGRYIDRLERRGGAWKIAFRYTVMEWSGTVPAAVVPLFDKVPGLHLNGVPSRSRDDPSYRRPLTNRRDARVPPDVRALSLPGT